MIKLERVTKRWMLRSLIILAVALIVIESLVIFITKDSFYSSAKQTVKTRAAVLQTTLSAYALDANADFPERIRELVENFSDKDKMELVAIDRNRKAVISSSGFAPKKIGKMEDLQEAINSTTLMGESMQKSEKGETVYCVTILSPVAAGDIMALRLLASFSPANRQILELSAIYVLVGLLIVAFILIYNLGFIHSIMKPIADVEKTAQKIAAGDFETRIEHNYKDEMGDLCNIVNYMADELSQGEQLKNEFISSVSHELRTPLTAIKGWSETLLGDNTGDSAFQKRGLNVISGETDRLSSIVEDLLDFSKMQNGRFSIKKEKMDVLAELEEAILVFSQRAEREGITLEYNEPEMLSAILGDKNRIRQVFVNVLDNALKYSEKGGRICVVAREEYGIIYISISDEGCGISPEDLPRIKKKFYKANLSRRGSGIGLAVVDEIVSVLGGTFDIESRLGEGTTVTISFPVFIENKEAQ